MDYFLGASAFLSVAGALFAASDLTASLFAFFSSFLAGTAVAGAEVVAAGAGAALGASLGASLAGSAAKAVTANADAISADTSFMDISLV
jgi:hypothetical protein